MRGNSEIIQGIKILLAQGQPGSSIDTIEKTSSSGAVDTYTITLTDGSTSTFEVTNGTPIQSVVLTSTSDEYDTYTITDNAGNTSTFQVKNHDKDMTDFEAEINDLLDNTPYLVYDSDAVPQLPVYTIDDLTESTSSTWSSEKIQQMLDEYSNLAEYIPVINPSTVGIANKCTLSGGCYKIGRLVFVNVSAVMTRSITKSHTTGNYAVIPEPEHDETPLYGLYISSTERRYTLIAVVRNQGEGVSDVGLIGFNSPDVDIPNGGKITIGGVYVAKD